VELQVLVHQILVVAVVVLVQLVALLEQVVAEVQVS
jgi:hypothetical protein